MLLLVDRGDDDPGDCSSMDMRRFMGLGVESRAWYSARSLVRFGVPGGVIIWLAAALPLLLLPPARDDDNCEDRNEPDSVVVPDMERAVVKLLPLEAERRLSWRPW